MQNRPESFEDLVTDLKNELLLDNDSDTKIRTDRKIYIPSPKQKSLSPDETPLAAEISEATPDVEFNNPVPSIQQLKPTSLTQIQLKPKQKGRYCPTCLISVPKYRFSCKFCGERMSSNFVYYPIILILTLGIIGILLFIILSKN